MGINNSVEEYIAALERHKPDILGMSALLTTTMPYMKVVIDALKDQGLRDKYIVMVGAVRRSMKNLALRWAQMPTAAMPQMQRPQPFVW